MGREQWRDDPPEPPTANATAEASRFWSTQYAGPGKFFAVGNLVRFDAATPPANFPFPHATEDRVLIAGRHSAILGQMTAAQMVQAVAADVAASIDEAFGGNFIEPIPARLM